MIGVNVKDNESIDRAINRFKKMVTRSRVLNEYKDRQQYTKPSEERREALKKSIREQRRRQREITRPQYQAEDLWPGICTDIRSVLYR
jgi:small subunit ribosomal protein S21